MIRSIQFQNFRVLRNTTLPLGPLTVIVGPNGSGKSTALQGLELLKEPSTGRYECLISAGSHESEAAFEVRWDPPLDEVRTRVGWQSGGSSGPNHTRLGHPPDTPVPEDWKRRLDEGRAGIRVFRLDPRRIAAEVPVPGASELGPDGLGLAAVLDGLRDQYPERFDALNEQSLPLWVPEFDRILFKWEDGRQGGLGGGEGPTRKRLIQLRTRDGGHPIDAIDLSDGTLLALAVLTIAHLPHPPTLAAFETPEAELHPRLLPRLKDALYRLAFPKEFGESRSPVQVVVTTQSPYFLDLFRDHPEEVVVASKLGIEVTFERVSDMPNIAEILEGAPPLGDVWYTGVLGGVPVGV